MPDEFSLEPDIIEPEAPERRTPPKYIPLGGPLAPTAAIPSTRRRASTRPRAAVYAPCPKQCGALVLSGATEWGEVLVLDPAIPCFVALWHHDAPMPTFSPSRGYPVHCCKRTYEQGV